MRKKLNTAHLAVIIVLMFVAFFIANNNQFIKIMNQNTDKTLPDINFNSSTEYIYGYLDDIGPAGRQAYRDFLLVIDMIFPVVYSTLSFFVLLFIQQRINDSGRITKTLVYFPFLCGCFDIIENIHILVLLRKYPDILDLTARSLSLVTSVKAVSVIIFFSIFICFIIMAVVERNKDSV